MDSGAIGIAVLAAGASKRFGPSDKLTAQFRGKPLGEHVSAAIPRGQFTHRWIIVSDPEHPCGPTWKNQGLELVMNETADQGMGTSVACAARLAMDADCTALIIALADMPCVPPQHFLTVRERVMQAGSGAAVASTCGGAPMPPAAFGAGHFLHLAELEGDRGARAILADAELIECPPEWLIDIDTPAALEARQ